MCGISGIVEFNNKIDENVLADMSSAIGHRGPDDFSYYTNNKGKYSLGLAHQRLSILDLSNAGKQPMTYQNLTIAFNGEVYNFSEIKKQLIFEGYDFISNSDTEVILKSIHCWGLDAVHKFNGMFAIALFDEDTNKLFLIRDRAGVKPIFYSFSENRIIFSSELKSFHKYPDFFPQINKKSLSSYLYFGYIPKEECIFDGVTKILPGEYVEFDLTTKNQTSKTYWSVTDFYKKTNLDLNEKDAEILVEDLLISSAKYRMISDVPVGVFLSGGYDSSLLTAILAKHTDEKLKTFTIGFSEGDFNEANEAKNISDYLGTEHTELYCTEADCLKLIDKLPDIWDEPFSDNSMIPTFLVSELAKEKVKVVLSADGGDELFGGYDKYNTALKIKRIKKVIPFKKAISKFLYDFSSSEVINKYNSSLEHRIKRISESITAKNDYELLSSITSVFAIRELDKLLVDKVSFSFSEAQDIPKDELKSLLAIDYNTWQVDDILQKVDRATMANSIEGREPFLDFRLVELISRIPSNYKIKKGSKKYILKQISKKYIPSEMLDRPKKGFNIPIHKWMNTDLLDKYDKLFSGEFIKNQGLFVEGELALLIKKCKAGNRHASYKLWSILMFQLWYKRWILTDE